MISRVDSRTDRIEEQIIMNGFILKWCIGELLHRKGKTLISDHQIFFDFF